MVYDPQTPYTILQNASVDFATMQRIKRFARYWEMLANAGRFSFALKLLLENGSDSVFHHFLNFSDWLWQTTGKTHEFAMEKLVDLLHQHLTLVRGLPPLDVQNALLADYQTSGARGKPLCLAALLSTKANAPSFASTASFANRQARHVLQKTSS